MPGVQWPSQGGAGCYCVVIVVDSYGLHVVANSNVISCLFVCLSDLEHMCMVLKRNTCLLVHI